MARVAAAANATAISIAPHLGRRDFMSWLISPISLRDARNSISQ
jgi:hypothetical protein